MPNHVRIPHVKHIWINRNQSRLICSNFFKVEPNQESRAKQSSTFRTERKETRFKTFTSKAYMLYVWQVDMNSAATCNSSQWNASAKAKLLSLFPVVGFNISISYICHLWNLSFHRPSDRSIRPNRDHETIVTSDIIKKENNFFTTRKF